MSYYDNPNFIGCSGLRFSTTTTFISPQASYFWYPPPNTSGIMVCGSVQIGMALSGSTSSGTINTNGPASGAVFCGHTSGVYPFLAIYGHISVPIGRNPPRIVSTGAPLYGVYPQQTNQVPVDNNPVKVEVKQNPFYKGKYNW